MLDRSGSRPLFIATGVLATGGLLLASVAPTAWMFAVAGAVGGGAVGAGGYYSATQAVAARLTPDRRARSITAITLWGAFSSPIFLPLMGWLVETSGWRMTVRLAAAAVGAAFAAAIVSLPSVHAKSMTGSFRRALGRAAADPTHRRLFLTGTASGVCTSILLLYQVPAMTTAGLALTTASSLAGARGLAQLGGRLPLPPVVDRFGSGPTLRGSYLITAMGGLALLAAATIPVALAYVALAGVGIGALSALEGIFAAEVVDESELGTNLGLLSLLRGIGAASGPVIGGITIGITGSRTIALLLAVVTGAGAALLLPAATIREPAGSGSVVGSGEGTRQAGDRDDEHQSDERQPDRR